MGDENGYGETVAETWSHQMACTSHLAGHGDPDFDCRMLPLCGPPAESRILHRSEETRLEVFRQAGGRMGRGSWSFELSEDGTGPERELAPLPTDRFAS